VITGRAADARAASRIWQEHTCSSRTSATDGVLVNGVRVDRLGAPAFLVRLDDLLACGKSHVVHFLSAHPTVEARHDPRYRQILNEGTVNMPDGLPVVWAGRAMGTPLHRLTGTDAMPLVTAWGLERALAHSYYGGAPGTLASLQDRLAQRFPGVTIVGAESPPFRDPTDAEFVADAKRIRTAGTEALWVGLGTPKQDLVAHRLAALDVAPLIFCVGAAFDFIAGNKRRAPAWAQAVGMEWAFRLASEPTRLWKRYLVGNPQFVAGVVADRVKGNGVAGA
jgi:N-acetylglucosaminyldiphosphoundecaprenol N-acetyl-beta-D-mannosaminyltransferase